MFTNSSFLFSSYWWVQLTSAAVGLQESAHYLAYLLKLRKYCNLPRNVLLYCSVLRYCSCCSFLKAIREIFHISSCHMLKNYFKWFILLIEIVDLVFLMCLKDCIKAYECVWDVDPQKVMTSVSSTPWRWLASLKFRKILC